MVDVANEQPFDLVQGRAASDLCLRVVGSSRDGQLIRLAAAKCTIGSSRRCTLRLSGAGVRPVHCLILRGSRGTVIRSCGAGTLLNGATFADAPLGPGDRLSIGRIELEVLASKLRSREAGSPGTANSPALTTQLFERRFRDQVRISRARTRMLLDAVRTLRAEVARLYTLSIGETSQQNANLESELSERRDELQRQYADLESQRQELADRWQQFESESAESRQNLEYECNSLVEAECELTHQREAFQQHKAAQLAEVERVQEELDQTRGELEQLREELDQQRQESESNRFELETQRAELSAQRDELARAQAELEEARSRHADEVQQFNQRRKELDDAQNAAQTGRDEAAARLTEERDQLDAERADLERRNTELSARWAECDQRQDALERQQTELKDELHKLAEWRGELERSQSELESGRAEVEANQARNAQREAEIDRAQQDLQTKANELRQQQARHEADRAELDAAHRESSEAVATAAQQSELQCQAALAHVHSVKATWAIEQLAWESAQAVAEEQLDRRNQALVEQEQRVANQVEHQQSLDERLAEIRRETETLERARIGFETHRQEHERRLRARDEELEQRESVLEAQQQELAAESASVQENTERDGERLAELEQLRTTLADQRDALRSEQRDDVAREPEVDHDDSEPSGAFDAQAVASDEATEAALYDEAPSANESVDGEIEDSVETVQVEVETTTTSMWDDDSDTTESPVVDDAVNEDVGEGASEDARKSLDEDSIEQYMEALLSRMRGVSAATFAPQEPVRNKRKSDPKPVETLEPVAAETPLDVPVVDVASSEPELKRRPAVTTGDLASMRELANTQAQLALDTHGRKRLVHTAFITSSATLGCLLATTLVLYFLPYHHTALRTLAMSGFVGSVFWLAAASTAVQQLFSARKAQEAGLRGNIERADTCRVTPTDD